MKKNKLTISIIIPVLNEERFLGKALHQIQTRNTGDQIKEIICVDGGSTDTTIDVALANGATVIRSKRGRAAQMNAGAKKATGDILYFLHADTLPPLGFDDSIVNAVSKNQSAGCFRMRFDTNNPILRFFAWLSRINHVLCRGGDQSLFIKKALFERTKGFNEAYLIYEDTEFIKRLYKATTFVVLPQHVVTSARMYRKKGWLRVQYHFAMIHLKNHLGAKPEELYQYYQRHFLT